MHDVLWLVEDYSRGGYHQSEPRAVFDTKEEAEEYANDGPSDDLVVTSVHDLTGDN